MTHVIPQVSRSSAWPGGIRIDRFALDHRPLSYAGDKPGAMSNTIKVGDVVQLKSGGPEMTVAKVTPEEVLCTWWSSKESDHKERGFHPALLVVVGAQTSATPRPARRSRMDGW